MADITVGEWVNETISNLKGKTDFPVVETYALTTFVLECTKESIYAHPERIIPAEVLVKLNSFVTRLISREPLAYLIGKRSFFGLEFQVNPGVLIPRPETELLVEEAINWLEKHPAQRSVADIGTGSGAIAISLIDHFADIHMIATDISNEALSIAKLNAAALGVSSRIEFKQNDLLDGMVEQIDLLLANLPYIPTIVLDQLDVVRFEPRIALDGGKTGLELIEKMLVQSKNIIKAGGCILLEIQFDQRNLCTELAASIYPNASIQSSVDLAGIPRLVKIQV